MGKGISTAKNLDATGLRFAIVVSRFNSELTQQLADDAFRCLEENGAKVVARHKLHGPMMVSKSVGNGRAYVLGGFVGQGYFKKRDVNFEKMIEHIVAKAGAMPELCVKPKKEIVWRTGRSGKKRLLFVMNAGPKRDIIITAPSAMCAAPKIFNIKNNQWLPTRTHNKEVTIKAVMEQGDYEIYQWEG